MCTVKDLKSFLGSRGMTVAETRSLIFKMLDCLDEYEDEGQKILIKNGNDYKPAPFRYIMPEKV